MASSTSRDLTVTRPATILLFLAALAAAISPTQAAYIAQRDGETCPSSYKKCANADLTGSFCCPSSSTCVSVDGGSTAICCPQGQSCTYIQPITCNLELQDGSSYPKNPVKTTKLKGRLPTCGDSCCPFGYSCQGDNLCVMNDSAPSASSSQTTKGTAATTKITLTQAHGPTATDSSPKSTFTTAKSQPTTTEPPSITTADDLFPTFIYSSNYPRVSTSKVAIAGSETDTNKEPTCPAVPAGAVMAGLFPGIALGAALALLIPRCVRRYKESHLPPSVRVAQNTKRTSNGTLLGISDPIPSEDSACRTDFLLSRNPRRNSEGARSMLQRTGTRVKSLFGGTPKITVQGPDGAAVKEAVPPLPPVVMPSTPPRQVMPRRQPSTESIKVYTPPGVFASTTVLMPEPYPAVVRPNTTFSDMIDRSREAAPETPPKDRAPNILRVPRR